MSLPWGMAGRGSDWLHWLRLPDCCYHPVLPALVDKQPIGMHNYPNLFRYALACRAGLQLVLSAALELADEPPAAQPSILVLPLSSLSRGSSPALPDDEQQQRQQQAVSPPGQLLPPRPRRLRQGQQPLAIECRDVPLTCVLVAGSQELLVAGAGLGRGLCLRTQRGREAPLSILSRLCAWSALDRAVRLVSFRQPAHHPACVPRCSMPAGDGSGEVRLLSFDPLWRSYTWGRSLPPAKYR